MRQCEVWKIYTLFIKQISTIVFLLILYIVFTVKNWISPNLIYLIHPGVCIQFTGSIVGASLYEMDWPPQQLYRQAIKLKIETNKESFVS